MIYSIDIKITEKLTPYYLSSLFQDIAFKHSTLISASEESLLEKNYTWILSNLKFQILYNIPVGSIVKLKTWTIKDSKLYYKREFELEYLGKACVIASSNWLIMDYVNRKIIRDFDIHQQEIGEELVHFEIKRLKTNYEDLINTNLFEYKVTKDEIDQANHFNNCYYALLISKVYEDDIKEYQIDFLKELKLDDKVYVLLYENKNERYVIGIKEDEQISFIAKIS